MSEKKKTDVQKLFGGNKAGFEQLVRESAQREDMAFDVVKSMRGLFGENADDFDKEIEQLEKEKEQRKSNMQKLADSIDEDDK